MIGVFPELIPDELLYSGFARYGAMFGYNMTALSTELFGVGRVSASIDFPQRLDSFAAKLPPGSDYSSELLITNHTPYPYYAPFIPVARAEMVVTRLRGQRTRSVYRLLNASGGARSTMLHRYMRFCTECASNDVAKYGAAAWRRTHQMPSVIVCETHGIPLHESTVLRRLRVNLGGYFPLTDEVIATASPIAGDITASDLRWIARDTAWLMRYGRASDSFVTISQRYASLLRQRNWLDSRGHLYCTAFQRAVESYFGSDLLRELNTPVRLGKRPSWPVHTVLSGEARPPLHHILVLRFLASSVREFMGGDEPAEMTEDANTSRRRGTEQRLSVACRVTHQVAATAGGPLGPRPLAGPCRNPLCSEFKKEALGTSPPEVKELREARVMCTVCGFEYLFRTAAPGIYQIVSVGPIWLEALRERAADPRYTFGEIGQVLGVSVSALHCLIQRHGVRTARVRTRFSAATLARCKKTIAVRAAQQMSDDRRELQNIRHASPKATRTEIRKRIPAAYGRLWRNDRDWTIRELPPAGTGHGPDGRWDERDTMYASAVPGVVQAILSLDRPVRITASSIGRHFGGAPMLYYNRAEFPKTWAEIEAVIESKDDFRMRRLSSAQH